MSIEKILEKIDEDTRSAVSEIMSRAQSKAERVKEEYDKRAEKIAEEMEKESKKKADEETHRLIVNEQLELRKSLLQKKREILNDFFEDAKKRIEKMPKEEFAGFIEKLILKRAATGREEIVIASKQEGVYSDGFVDSLNGSFPGGGSFSLAEPSSDFSWGVVLREGNRRVDLSLDVLFLQIAEEVEAEVAACLLGKGGKG